MNIEFSTLDYVWEICPETKFGNKGLANARPSVPVRSKIQGSHWSWKVLKKSWNLKFYFSEP